MTCKISVSLAVTAILLRDAVSCNSVMWAVTCSAETPDQALEAVGRFSVMAKLFHTVKRKGLTTQDRVHLAQVGCAEGCLHKGLHCVVLLPNSPAPLI